MNEGEIVQSGTPVDIYDEPINHFVATFIGESNILDERMIEDYLVQEFNGLNALEAVDGECVQMNQLKSSFVLKTCKCTFLKKASSK